MVPYTWGENAAWWYLFWKGYYIICFSARGSKGEDGGGESGTDKAGPSQFPAYTSGEEIAPAYDRSEVKDLRSQIYVHLLLNNLSFHSFFL